MTGRQLFVAGCANCHAGDGRGATRSQVGFADAIPDFTDCAATSREARRDWMAVVHEGGRVRAFSHRMPAFGSALSPAQIERVVAYLRTLCDDARWPHGELNLPRPIETEKAFPEDETALTVGAVAARGSREATGAIVYEKRLGARAQWEVNIPFGTRQRAETDGGGWTGGYVGDIALALKRVFHHSPERGTIVSAAAELALPTGDRRSGFGAGTVRIEPALLMGQILPGDGFVQLQGGVQLSASREKAPHEAFWRSALGRSFAPGFGRMWSPMVELTGARELERDAATQWDAIPQMQVTLSRRQHVRGSVGVRLPLTQRTERPRELVAYLLWDWYDGGLFDGW